MDSETSERIEETLKQRVEQIEKSQAQSAPQQHPLLTIPVATQAPHGNIPNTPLASSTIAFLLGGLFFLGFVTFALGGFTTYWWTTAQLGFFVAAWAGFHWGEFAVTAGWNLEKCSVDSYLLDNGAMYHVANGAALTEYLISLYFWPHLKTYRYVTATGIALVMFGQLLRSAAMIHASTNFSHAVAYSKRKTHTLVTDGVYAWLRHPSYAGFYYWALGTQLVLQNPMTFVLFAILLTRFFSDRTKWEEKSLIRFFGDDYIQYRQRVGTMIPFVP